MRICALLLVIAGAPAIAADQEQSIKELVAKYSVARESRDPAAIDQLFTDDADQLVSSGTWRRGRETLVKGMMQSSTQNPGSRTITVETVRFVAKGVALADARYVILGTNGAADRRMWSTFLCVETDNGWRITAIRNMNPAR